ncbi:hypothetical protein FRC20_008784 [Serendipita sp. 405]|nr:hypothetical protein FRC20_008784 [Serendipita sp. 405]
MSDFVVNNQEQAQEMLSANGDNRLPTKMPAPIDVLLQIIPEHAAGQQTLLRIRQLLHEVSERDEGLATYIGWIFLGVLLLHLYIPSLPLDPEAAISGVRRRLEKAEARLKEEIFLHRRAEGLSTGDSSNSVIESLEALLVGVEDRLKDFPVPIQPGQDRPFHGAPERSPWR